MQLSINNVKCKTKSATADSEKQGFQFPLSINTWYLNIIKKNNKYFYILKMFMLNINLNIYK